MRQCEWCGDPSQRATCGSAHRGARWRFLRNIGNDEPPWLLSPLHGRRGEEDPAKQLAEQALAEEAKVEQERDEARAAAERAEAELAAATAPGPRSGSNARSGTMISYRKTRALLIDKLAHFPGGERLIDEALHEALPPRVREQEANNAAS